MTWVLIAIVIGNVILQAVTQHDLTTRLDIRHQTETAQQNDLVRVLVMELEQTRRQEIVTRQHQDDLQHDITMRELDARTAERVAALQQPVSPVPPWDDRINNYDYVDPDPTPMPPNPFTEEPQQPDYNEQVDGAFALPPDREQVAVVRPGESLIPHE